MLTTLAGLSGKRNEKGRDRVVGKDLKKAGEKGGGRRGEWRMEGSQGGEGPVRRRKKSKREESKDKIKSESKMKL